MSAVRARWRIAESAEQQTEGDQCRRRSRGILERGLRQAERMGGMWEVVGGGMEVWDCLAW